MPRIKPKSGGCPESDDGECTLACGPGTPPCKKRLQLLASGDYTLREVFRALVRYATREQKFELPHKDQQS
jgi:hypothetical protein